MRLFRKIPKAAILLGAVMLSGIIAGCGSKKEESYRSIKVYEVDGKGWVTREGVGEMELYANMQLQSHDQLRTDSESYVQLKLDEDKYVLLEPDTKIKIEAEGDAKDSRTKIVLEEGAVVNRIENKLSDKSSYEVESPNSTMAVRGTTFRVSVVKDKNGKLVSEVEVQDGRVDCKILIKGTDGKASQQIVTLEAGRKTIIQGTLDGAEYVSKPMEYTYEIYENEVLTFIGYSDKKDENREDSSEEEGWSESDEDKEEQEDSGETEEEGDSKEQEDITKDETKESEETTKEEQESNQANTEGESSSEDYGEGSTGDGGNTGGGGSTGGGNTEESSEEESSEEESSEEESSEEETTEYTVTFTYNGTFATQTVTSGSKATQPTLMPTASGAWYQGDTAFDFSTEITSEITLVWKNNG